MSPSEKSDYEIIWISSNSLLYGEIAMWTILSDKIIVHSLIHRALLERQEVSRALVTALHDAAVCK